MNEPTTPPRWAYYISPDDYVAGEGFRVSTIHEDEAGRRRTGSWPYDGKKGQTLPYFWSHDFAESERIAAKKNLERGLSPQIVSAIILASMQVAGV